MPMTHLILGHFMGSGDARDHHHTKIQAMTRGSEQCRLTCLSLDLLPTWTAVVVLSEKTVVHQRRGCDHVSRKVR